MNFYVTVLGSGAALPIAGRNCASQVVNINGFKLMIDCAEATQEQVRRNHIKLQSIGTVVISHLHGDHFFGLPGLLSTMHLCGRTEPMNIVAPVGAREVVETVFNLTGNHIGYPLVWQELDFTEGERRVVENRWCSVDAFPIEHTVPAYGFRIREVPRGIHESRSYAYCCDTVYTESIVPHVAGVDLLCLECTFANELAQLAAERKHLTAGQAGRLAAQAGVGQLLLTHISARYRDTMPLLEQASAEFANSLVASDSMRVEVKKATAV